MQKKGVDSSFDWMFSGINRIHNLEPSPELAKVSFEVDFDTHPGPHKVNEDKLLRLSQQGFFGAFDGMGGTLEAALPSSTEAAEAMRRGYTATRQQVLGSEQALTTQSARQLVERLMLQANQGVLNLKKTKGYKDVGTTGTVGQFYFGLNGELRFMVGQSGDSRAYTFFLDTGELTQLTTDQSRTALYLKYLVATNEMTQADADQLSWLLDNAAHETDLALLQPGGRAFFDTLLEISNTMTGCLGGQANSDTHIAIDDYEVQNNEIVLLCTDGLSGNLSNPEIQQILVDSRGDVAVATRELKNAAIARSEDSYNGSSFRAQKDDISLQLIAPRW